MINDPIEYRKLASAYKNYGIAIRISELSKSYESREVLNHLDLDILSGEFIAIVGRSGCGKSTLLRILAQLDEAQDGSLTFADRDEKDKSDVRIMFQDSRLLPWRTVLKNVALGLTKKEIPRAEDALNKVGLLDRAHDWPAKLSGGQRQRVALARALVHKPRLLLLDEPLGALDALTRIEMQQLIEELWLQHKFTAVLVTHDVQEAVALADRVILLEEGKVGLDLAVNLSRPRSRGSPAFANLEAELLERVLKHPHHQFDQKPAFEFFDGSETLKFDRFNWAV